MERFWQHIDEGWLDYVLLALVGRTVMAFLPPGRVGGTRPMELALTLAVSVLLGQMVMFWTVSVLPDVDHAQRWWLSAPWLALGALRWWTRPHAFVAGEPVPLARDKGARAPAGLVVLLASASPLWWVPDATREDLAGRAMASIGLFLIAVVCLHALYVARRVLAGRVLIVVLLVTTPALRESVFHLPTLPAAFVALTCAGLIGWTRRADPRHAALAALGAAATFPYSPTTWIAGLATLALFSHNHARRRALITALALAALFVAPIGWLGSAAAVRLTHASDLPILAPSFTAALERRELWGLVWHACGLALIAALVGVCGGRAKEMKRSPSEAEPPKVELRAVLVFTALALAAHAALSWTPVELIAEHARPTWLGLLAMLLPAAALVLALVFTPGERSAERGDPA